MCSIHRGSKAEAWKDEHAEAKGGEVDEDDEGEVRGECAGARLFTRYS